MTFEVLKPLQEIEWKQDWFPHIPKYSSSFWQQEFNQRDFLSRVATTYKLETLSDWSRISSTLIKNNGGAV